MRRNLTGQEFGMLRAESYAGIVNGRSHWDCVCQCGKGHRVRESHLLSGNVTSCGCMAHKRKTPNIGAPRKKSKIYMVWNAMKARCLNPNSNVYKHYGGRGITVCPEWMEFGAFYRDMGDVPFEGAQIDRRDNMKGYSKENCRWVTRKENYRNTRSNRLITAEGKTMTLVEWAEHMDTPTSTIYRRISKGMTEEQAVSIPRNRTATRRLYAAACLMAEEAAKGVKG